MSINRALPRNTEYLSVPLQRMNPQPHNHKVKTQHPGLGNPFIGSKPDSGDLYETESLYETLALYSPCSRKTIQRFLKICVIFPINILLSLYIRFLILHETPAFGFPRPKKQGPALLKGLFCVFI